VKVELTKTLKILVCCGMGMGLKEIMVIIWVIWIINLQLFLYFYYTFCSGWKSDTLSL